MEKRRAEEQRERPGNALIWGEFEEQQKAEADQHREHAHKDAGAVAHDNSADVRIAVRKVGKHRQAL